MLMVIKLCLLLLCFIGFSTVAAGARLNSNSPYFNVKEFGATGNGKTDDTKAFQDAWKATCGASGDVKLLIPHGNYLIGPVDFRGWCKKARSVTIQLQGILKASTDMRKFGEHWIMFGWIDRLTITGGGTFDGQGASAWPSNRCPQTSKCKLLPVSIKFVAVKNTVVQGVSSLNSKQYHFVLLHCQNFKASGLTITAPSNSPNTDGIHMESSSGIRISSSKIGTGDDCISVGQGNSDVTLSGITCGPGHGISVGSLGKYSNEGDVRGLLVKDSSISNTMNGVRIKTWQNSPSKSVANNITFQNIVMNNVGNPIIIDQQYCPYASCSAQTPSKVKLSNISFKNIRGTSATQVAITIHCSKGFPCQRISLQNVHLDYSSGKAISSCKNVKATYSGTQIPPACK